MIKLYYARYDSYCEDDGHNSYMAFRLHRDKSKCVSTMNDIIRCYKRNEDSDALHTLNKGGYLDGQEEWYAYDDEYELQVNLMVTYADVEEIDSNEDLFGVTRRVYSGSGFDDYKVISVFNSKLDARNFLDKISKEAYEDYKKNYDYTYYIDVSSTYARIEHRRGTTEEHPSEYYSVERFTIL